MKIYSRLYLVLLKLVNYPDLVFMASIQGFLVYMVVVIDISLIITTDISIIHLNVHIHEY